MPPPLRTPEPYARLGVKPVINAQSWVTGLGGSLMRPEVLSAMNEAATCFVDMVELNRAAGQVVARACGAESGMVTAGASAAGTIAVAACMTGVDRARVEQLPDSTGMKNEVVVFWGERNRYDMSFELPGARIVEWGVPGAGAAYQLDAAITERTCAVAAVFQPLLKRGLPVNEMCEVAHARNVPVIVDAAAEVPPLANLTRFIQDGADLAFFSGGKGIGGPQNAGLLAGRSELMEAAYVNALNLDAPRAGVARGMKASKESIVGMVTALELLIETGEDALYGGLDGKGAAYSRPPGAHPGASGRHRRDGARPAWTAAGGLLRTGMARALAGGGTPTPARRRPANIRRYGPLRRRDQSRHGVPARRRRRDRGRAASGDSRAGLSSGSCGRPAALISPRG